MSENRIFADPGAPRAGFVRAAAAAPLMFWLVVNDPGRKRVPETPPDAPHEPPVPRPPRTAAGFRALPRT